MQRLGDPLALQVADLQVAVTRLDDMVKQQEAKIKRLEADNIRLTKAPIDWPSPRAERAVAFRTPSGGTDHHLVYNGMLLGMADMRLFLHEFANVEIDGLRHILRNRASGLREIIDAADRMNLGRKPFDHAMIVYYHLVAADYTLAEVVNGLRAASADSPGAKKAADALVEAYAIFVANYTFA